MTELPEPRRPHLVVVDRWLRCAATEVHARRLWLTELDAAIGDGDHGINLDRGLTGVLADLETGGLDADDAGTMLVAVGRRLLGLVGGASGALYGRGMMAAGDALRSRGDADAPDALAMARVALGGAVAGIVALGRATPGDKTMLDALAPALAVLEGAPPAERVEVVMRRMADAAQAGAAATVPLVARKGRASYLGERSAGHLDPGAASSAIMIRCLADVVSAHDGRPSARRQT